LAITLKANIGAFPLILELLKPLFRNDLQGLPCLDSASGQSYILNELAIAYGEMGREEDALAVLVKSLQLCLQEENWRSAGTGLRNLSTSFAYLQRRAERIATLSLARELAEAADDEDGVTVAILFQMVDAVTMGRFAEAEQLVAEFRQRPQPHVAVYSPGDAEYHECKSQFYQGKLSDADWQTGYDLAVRHRNVFDQYRFLALRAEWDLGEDRAARALESITQALQITNKHGTPKPAYHDLRAWSLARVGRVDDAKTELQAGEQRLFAAETHLVLGDRDLARTCTLNAYRRAWGEGPPYINWYNLKRSRALLRQLGEPEPQLPSFDPSKVPRVPFEKEIRAVIAKLKAEKEQQPSSDDSEEE